jgi:hypothetical protein
MSKKEKLCNLITMHKCHIFLTVVQNSIHIIGLNVMLAASQILLGSLLLANHPNL